MCLSEYHGGGEGGADGGSLEAEGLRGKQHIFLRTVQIFALIDS